jgi:hypothetical protein
VQLRLVDYTYYLGVYILNRFMGDFWLNRHVISRENIGYDYFKASSDFSKEQYKNTHRIIRVAEMLFNFQDIPGFSRLLTSLEHDHRGIEPTVAEIEVAVMLHVAGIPFAFVEPKNGMGGDYDIEIRYPDGWTAAVEIKCKTEGTALNASTIGQALKHARKQLPKDKPCFVFMKIPDAWS